MGVSDTQWSSFLLFCTLLLFHMGTHLPASFSLSAPLLLVGRILSRHFFAFPSPSHGHACLPIFSLSLSLSLFMPRVTGEVNRPFTHMGCLMSLCHTTVTPPVHLLLLAQVNEEATLFHSWLGCSSAFFTSNNILFHCVFFFKTMEVNPVHIHLDELSSTWFAFSEMSDVQNNPPSIRQHLY